MRPDIRKRCVTLGRYMLQTGATIRQCAQIFGMSKSSVHKDLQVRLRAVHPGLYQEVRRVLNHHLAVRHLRGGFSTRLRWEKYKENQK